MSNMKTEFEKHLPNYYNNAGLSIEEQAWAIWQDAWQAQQARHRDWLFVQAMSEIKATVDGNSTQPIADIIEGLIEELNELSDSR